MTRAVSQGRCSSSTMTAVDHKAVFRRRLVNSFRPVLELLWPGDNELDHPDGDAGRLVQFFMARGIFRWDRIGMFDAHHLKLKSEECDLFKSEDLVGKLGFICRFIQYFGPQALLTLKNKHGANANPTRIMHKIESAVATYSARQGLFEIEKLSGKLDVSMRGLRSLSLVQARRLFVRQLSKLNFWELPFDDLERSSWLRQGAMHLLDEFPILASEEVRADRNYNVFPYAYFMWAGFGRDVVCHVVGKYKNALYLDIQNNKHLKFLKLQRSRSSLPLPLEVIQTLLEANKSLLQNSEVEGRLGSQLLELAIRQGYRKDVLAYILESGARDVNSLWLMNFDGPVTELGDDQIFAIEVLLPRLRFLDSHLSWTQESEALLLYKIAMSCQHNNNLESLSLSLSPSNIYYSEMVRAMIGKVVQYMNKALKKVSLKMWDSPKLTHRNLYGSCFEAACEKTLEVISDGLCNCKKDRLEQLTLRGFHLSHSNPLEVLVSQDIVGCLNMQLDAGRDMYDFKVEPLQGRPKIHRLNLYDFSLSNETEAIYSWHAFWDCVRKESTALESVLLVPRHRCVEPEWVPHALISLAGLPHLRRLELGPHSSPRASGGEAQCVDISEALVFALEHGSIEKLVVNAWKQYRIQSSRFCEALTLNKTLQSLALKGATLEGTDVTKALFRSLQQSNNVTLKEAAIYDDRYFYTPTDINIYQRKHAKFRNHTYENYGYASQILHLLESNVCDRAWLQEKSATCVELVFLLERVHVTLSDYLDELDVLDLLSVAEGKGGTGSGPGTPLEILDQVYKQIHKDPMVSCDAVERAFSTLSIQYTLLRDNPGLWAGSAVLSSSPGDLSRKRQRVQ